MEVLLDNTPDAARPAPRAWHPSRSPVATRDHGIRRGGHRPAAGRRRPSGGRCGLARPHVTRRPGARQRPCAPYGLASVGRRAVAPTSVLNGPLGPHRRWGWARAELADVKRVKKAAGCSVNDVVLAAVAGGFREYLLARGEDVETTTIRSLVPVSVRTEEHRGPARQPRHRDVRRAAGRRRRPARAAGRGRAPDDRPQGQRPVGRHRVDARGSRLRARDPDDAGRQGLASSPGSGSSTR